MNCSKWVNLTRNLSNNFNGHSTRPERLRNFTIQEIVTLPSHIKRSYKFFSPFKILVLSSHIKAYLRSFSFISNELSFILSKVSIYSFMYFMFFMFFKCFKSFHFKLNAFHKCRNIYKSH